MRPFRPIGSVLVSVTTSSVATALPGSIASVQMPTIRLYNAGPNDCFVQPGASDAVAAVDGTSMIVPVGAIEVFHLLPSDTYLASRCASGGSAALHITRGEGI